MRGKDNVYTEKGTNPHGFVPFGMRFMLPDCSCLVCLRKCDEDCFDRLILLEAREGVFAYTADEICFFADCINGLPRKILGYHTPEELFDRQLDPYLRRVTSPADAADTAFVGAPLAPEGRGEVPPFGSQRCSTSICYLFENYCNLLLHFAQEFPTIRQAILNCGRNGRNREEGQ